MAAEKDCCYCSESKDGKDARGGARLRGDGERRQERPPSAAIGVRRRRWTRRRSSVE
jgi:hypothetical protein